MGAKTLIPPIPIGETLAGKYRIERILGAGAMGIVLQATHIELDQKVAIKFLLPSAAEDAETLTRFGREGRTLAKLESEHVIRVIDVGALGDGTPYMVMEYLEGRDLAAIIRERGAIPIRETLAWLLDACEAVADAHAAGIIHRDLKPANLFLVKRKTGRALLKVLDFGISKTLGKEELALTRTTAILGSPLYMAPEQLRESRSVDERTDVWALGVIAYELLTASVPFNANTLPGLVTKIVEETPVSPHAQRAEIPETLSKTIERCLEKEPDARWASVTILSRELRSALASLGDDDRESDPKGEVKVTTVPAISSFAASVDVPSTEPPGIGISTTTRGIEIITKRVEGTEAEVEQPAKARPGRGSDEEEKVVSVRSFGSRARWPIAIGIVAIGVTTLAVWGAADDESKRGPNNTAAAPTSSSIDTSVHANGANPPSTVPVPTSAGPVFSGPPPTTTTTITAGTGTAKHVTTNKPIASTLPTQPSASASSSTTPATTTTASPTSTEPRPLPSRQLL